MYFSASSYPLIFVIKNNEEEEEKTVYNNI